jgi:hypothetical protein
LSYNDIAADFGLTLTDPSSDGTKTEELYGWIPVDITLTKKPTGGPASTATASEGPPHDVRTEIATPDELIEALKDTPLWKRMTQDMKDKVEAII